MKNFELYNNMSSEMVITSDEEVVVAYMKLLSRYCTEMAQGTQVTWPIFGLSLLLLDSVGLYSWG
jgi:hypothetical protein